MSFEVNGTTFYPKTASEHAQSSLDEMNVLLANLGLQQMSASQANALWWFFLGSGSEFQSRDEEMYQASLSFDIANCSEDQIVSLLPIAGTSLIPATYTSVSIDVTATSSGSATIPAGTTLPFGNGTFVTQVATTVPASTTRSIVCVYSLSGRITCSAGQLTKFSTAITNVASVTNPLNAVPGRSAETVTEARTRLSTGQSLGTGLIGVTTALRSLPGITHAKVYFNDSTTTVLTLPGSITVPVRTAKIVIQGYSNKIAETYSSYMLSPTDGTLTQNWTSPSGQVIPVNYISSGSQNVYVRITVSSTEYLGSSYASLIRDAVYNLNNTAKIGDLITSQEVASIFDSFTEATILGVEVSKDGTTWAMSISTDADKIPVYTATSTYIPIVLVAT